MADEEYTENTEETTTDTKENDDDIQDITDGDSDEEDESYLLDFTGMEESDEDDEDEGEDDEEETSRTYRLDLDANRIIGTVDEQEAVEQAIRKAIITPRFNCLIYDDQYGCEAAGEDMSRDASKEYLETVIEGFVRDALSTDTRILDIDDFEVEIKGDSAYISFSVETIFGETDIEEVLDV